jgi:hypothetical protein
MLGLADEAWLRTVLQGAGFCALQVHRMPLMRRYRDLDEYWSAEVDEGGKRGAQLRALSTADAKASGRHLVDGLFQLRGRQRLRDPGVGLAVAAVAQRGGLLSGG